MDDRHRILNSMVQPKRSMCPLGDRVQCRKYAKQYVSDEVAEKAEV